MEAVYRNKTEVLRDGMMRYRVLFVVQLCCNDVFHKPTAFRPRRMNVRGGREGGGGGKKGV